MYSDLNLKDTRATALFKNLFDLCSEATPAPSLIVYLSASTELIIDRIAARKRDFEVHVDHRYFAAVNESYERFFVQ
jgi:deoxyadenosine/deoxycytidine kinase